MLAASNLSTFDNKVEHQNNSPFMLLVLPLKTASSSWLGFAYILLRVNTKIFCYSGLANF